VFRSPAIVEVQLVFSRDVKVELREIIPLPVERYEIIFHFSDGLQRRELHRVSVVDYTKSSVAIMVAQLFALMILAQ
jgi:hypothetical protein